MASANNGPESCFRGKAGFVNPRSALSIVLLLVLARTSGNAQETSMVFVESPTLHATFVEFPENYDPEVHRTLVIGLHGFGSSAERFLGVGPPFLEAGMIFASARAPYAFVYEDGRMGWDWSLQHLPMEVPDEQATDLSVAYLTEVISALQARYQADRVYVLGFSQGGAFAYMSGIANHDSLDGLIILSARFSESWFPEGLLTEANHLPVFISHGDAERASTMAAGEGARDVLTDLGYEVRYRTFPGGHIISPDIIAEVVAWIGGG